MDQIYTVWDTKAEEIHGGLLLMKHDAVAIRTFHDAYNTEGTLINKHPDDFKLISLGYIKGTELVADLRVILEGSTLKAMTENQK